MQDTIVALSSGRPPAGIAVIRTSGSQAHEAAVSMAGLLPPPRLATLRTLRHPTTGIELDTALILRFDSPSSATGENIIEYQCHGGRAVVAAILDALTSLPGVRPAEPGEFTRRAVANGRIDLTEAEGLADLLEAETELQRRAAFALAGGGLSRKVEAWQRGVLALSARAEAAIDYVGDDDETAIDTASLRADAAEIAAELREWLARPRTERLKDGIRVVVAGSPNAGKSSLVNALAGVDRAIVTAIPGTTRDSIEVPLSIDGMPFLLIDTAGLRDAIDPVEVIGVRRARDEIERADILLWLDDPAQAPRHPQLILINAKSDLEGDDRCPSDQRADLSVSAHTGERLGELLERIANLAIGFIPRDGDVSLNARQAEAITRGATELTDMPDDLLLVAEHLRAARIAFDQLTGRAGVEEAIGAIFTRFCLGK